MRVIITGGNGFIGCHLIRNLFSQGLDIKNLSRQEGYDLSDDCLQDVGSADAVIHLAAILGVDKCENDPKSTLLIANSAFEPMNISYSVLKPYVWCPKK